MRIITYNVNSVRERLRAVRRVVRKYAPDVLCLQETKVEDGSFPVDGFADLGLTELRIAGQKAYNGMAIVTPHAIRRTWSHDLCGLGEKRHLAVELASGLEIHNLYVPAGGDKPDPLVNARFAKKLDFLQAMARWMRRWPERSTRPRVLLGDLNVAPLPSDVWDHRKMRRSVTHTEVEVALLEEAMRALPWTDLLRRVVPAEDALFTWWSYRARDWQKVNKGRRLDHVWVSAPLADRIEDCAVATEVRGWKRPSDHAPVIVDLDWNEPARQPA